MSLLSQEKCCLSDSKAERRKMFEEKPFLGLEDSHSIPDSGVKHSHTPAGLEIIDLWPIVQLKPIIEKQKKQKSHN